MKKQMLEIVAACVLTAAFAVEAARIPIFGGKAEENETDNQQESINDTHSYSYIAPELGAAVLYSDCISFSVKNYADIDSECEITISADGKRVSTTTAQALKKAQGKLSITDDGENHLTPDTKYEITAEVCYPDGEKTAGSNAWKTAVDSYFSVNEGVSLFERGGSGFVKAYDAQEEIVCRGELVDEGCEPIAGKEKSAEARYVKLKLPVENGENELGEMQYVYKDCYIDYKLNKKVNRKSPSAVRNVVVNYATMMTKLPNQRYELSGEYVGKDSTVSDCSGMTELAYLQIGYYLEHYADRQANNYGKVIYNNLKSTGSYSGVETYALKNSSSRVDISKLVKGDLVFFMEATNNADDNSLYVDNGIGHVGMYLGGGKMAHFTAGYGIYNHPCRIEDLAQYDKGLRVVKAVRYVI